tara:strand:+ start:2742 stop:3707 length:966 start_codon:yes stop_codon:yes gene_type:complete
MISLDFYTYTINHPKYLEDTYENFFNNCTDSDLYFKTLYLNIDPYTDKYMNNTNQLNSLNSKESIIINENNIKQIEKIANNYFDKVIIRVSNTCDITDAFIWASNNIETQYFFLLYCFITHNGNCIKNKISLDYMMKRLANYDNVCQISLLTNNTDYIDYLTCCPTLWKTDYIKNIYLKYGSKYLQERYVLRELALLENIKGLTYQKTEKNKYYPNKLNNYLQYEKELKYPIIQNISSDNGIKIILNETIEWHKYIYDTYLQKKELNLNNNDNNKLKNILKKANDIEWIYRWTGIFSFIPKKNVNPNNRMHRPSSSFKANK